MWWVSVEHALCHDTAARLVQYHHVDPSSLVFLSILQDLASYTNIKFLSSQLAIFIQRMVLHENYSINQLNKLWWFGFLLLDTTTQYVLLI
jgi:hypothetical protein